MLTVPAGQKSATFTVTSASLSAPQDAKDFTLTLSNATGAGLGLTAQAKFTIFAVVDAESDPPDLNTLSGQIDDALASTNTTTGITGIVGTIDSTMTYLAGRRANNDWSNYNLNGLASLQERITNLIAAAQIFSPVHVAV